MNKSKVNKILLYAIFAVAGLGVVAIFVTATTYAQLGIAVVLYPLLAFFALKIFFPKLPKGVSQLAYVPQKAEAKSENGNVLDADKRTFLKIVGATGIFFFVSSLLGKWIGNVSFGKALQSATNTSLNGNPDSGGNQSSIFASGGYTIAEIDDGLITYYGFTNKDKSWLMMREDVETNSFRYAKGKTDFPNNWTNRANLRYDYFYNLR